MQIKQDFIPKNRSNRPGNPMNPTYITIHNTANTARGANAQMHARYVKNPLTHVSWHFTVDDSDTVYQHLPTNENGWHAGDGKNGTGNRRSIGVEICENMDGNQKKANDHAVWLVQKLMKDHNIPIEHVVPHKRWSGKNCPRKLLPNWNSFIEQIKEQPAKKQPAKKQPVKEKPTVETPKKETVQGSANKNINSIVDWMNKQGMNSSYANREKLAKQHGITNYTGSAKQNNELLNKLKGTKAKPVKKPEQTHKLPDAVYQARKPYPSGAGVKAVQNALATLYFYPDKGAKNNGIDGIYGPKTADAIKRFQSTQGLNMDGIYGPKTKQALEKALKK